MLDFFIGLISVMEWSLFCHFIFWYFFGLLLFYFIQFLFSFNAPHLCLFPIHLVNSQKQKGRPESRRLPPGVTTAKWICDIKVMNIECLIETWTVLKE